MSRPLIPGQSRCITPYHGPADSNVIHYTDHAEVVNAVTWKAQLLGAHTTCPATLDQKVDTITSMLQTLCGQLSGSRSVLVPPTSTP
ncbi:hypothetical protein FKM82_003491 [Ascaphus truei]